MSQSKLDNLTLVDAYGTTIPAGTAFRAVALMVRMEGVPATMAKLAQQSLASGRSATYPDTMRYAAGRIDDLDRFLAGEQTELDAYRNMKAAHTGGGAPHPQGA